MDISAGSLERRQSELAPQFPGRVSVERADLNFAVLPEQAYDVIVSSGTLHHLINIEHAAHQLKRALRPGGHLFVQDYVMEDRLQFSPTRRAIFEVLIARGKARGDLPHSTTVRWPAPDDPELSPFEAIRAEDTLAVLDGTLERISMNGSGALTFLLILLRTDDADARRFDNVGQHMRREAPYSLRRRVRAALGRERRPAMSQRFQKELLLMDSVCIDSDLLTPANVFAVYRRPAA
jgi:SAM-dependent methyltransferase